MEKMTDFYGPFDFAQGLVEMTGENWEEKI